MGSNNYVFMVVELTLEWLLGIHDVYVINAIRLLLVVFTSGLAAYIIKNILRSLFMGSIVFCIFFVVSFHLVFVEHVTIIPLIMAALLLLSLIATILYKTIIHLDPKYKHQR